MLDEITPLILTRDEEANIGRTLRHLTWARDVVVVDSLSRDATKAIALQFLNVHLVERPFDSLANQSNFGITQCQTEWVLLLDADYIVNEALVQELRDLMPAPDVGGYECPFRYAVNGKPLRASLYPPRIVLLRRSGAEVWQDGHAHRVRVPGRVERLRNWIVHDDRKSFARFVERQRTYMRQEAAKLRATPFRTLNAAGKVRRLRVIAPFAVLAYTLVAKRTILDGLSGLRYAFERFLAELILSVELFRD
jgi:glycosyltransferase involved in cell wall biosynthesis